MLTMNREDGYELSSDPGRVDVDRVHHWLCTDAYWALGRPREVLLRALDGSTVCGVYAPDGLGQVAFARVVTDGATFGWLCDVYVDRAHRGRGLGRWLVGAIRDDLIERGVRRMLLTTWDAHGVYAQVGFNPLAEPSRWMELDLRKPQVTTLTGKGTERAEPLTVGE